MASISDKTSGANALSQMKEHYSQKERTSEDRHREEIKELRESHRSELERLRTEMQNRVQKLQEESNTKLSQKDVQYQKEIESIRAMNAKRMRELKSNS